MRGAVVRPNISVNKGTPKPQAGCAVRSRRMPGRRSGIGLADGTASGGDIVGCAKNAWSQVEPQEVPLWESPVG